jgi:hypothetical protein
MFTEAKTKTEAKSLTEECNDRLREKNEKAAYYYNRFATIVEGMSIFIALGILLGFLLYIDCDAITWVFFVLAFINLGYVIRGSTDSSAVAVNLCIAQIIKGYSLLVLIIQVGFTAYYGALPSTEPNSVDQKLKASHPWFYSNLDVIGLRANLDYHNVDLNDPVAREALNRKAVVRNIAIVSFFLISIYLAFYFERQLKTTNEKENFGEDDYKKMFEYQDANANLAVDNDKHGIEAQNEDQQDDFVKLEDEKHDSSVDDQPSEHDESLD